MAPDNVHSFAEACSTLSCHALVPQSSVCTALDLQANCPDSSEKNCFDLQLSTELHVPRSSPAGNPVGNSSLLFDVARHRYTFIPPNAPFQADNQIALDLTLRIQRTVVLLI